MNYIAVCCSKCNDDLWWPVVNKKHGNRVNFFGTWLPGAEPAVKGEPAVKKAKVACRKAQKHPGIVQLDQFLLWPLELEADAKWPGGGKIPFPAMEYCCGSAC